MIWQNDQSDNDGSDMPKIKHSCSMLIDVHDIKHDSSYEMRFT